MRHFIAILLFICASCDQTLSLHDHFTQPLKQMETGRKGSTGEAWACQDVPGAAPPRLPVITAGRGHVRCLSAPSWRTTVAAEQHGRVRVIVWKTFPTDPLKSAFTAKDQKVQEPFSLQGSVLLLARCSFECMHLSILRKILNRLRWISV